MNQNNRGCKTFNGNGWCTLISSSKPLHLVGLVAFCVIFMALATQQANAKQAIVALVNDEPISKFDLKQRINLFLANSRQLRAKMQARLKSPNINQQFRDYAMRHNPKSKAEVTRLQKKFVSQIRKDIIRKLKPQARKLAMQELVEERIKLQEAKRLNIVVSDEKVSAGLANMAKRSKLSKKQFAKMMRGMGVDISTMRQRLKADMSWQKAVQRRFGRELSLKSQYFERINANTAATNNNQKNIELQLHRITLPISGRIDQQIMVARLAEAEGLRNRFKSCETVKSLLKNVENAKYENLGRKSASTFSEPTRTQLIQTKIGEMPPPSLSPQGIQLYAVCGRREIVAPKKKVVAAKKVAQQKEFNILSERHLRDLKQDAFIEYR